MMETLNCSKVHEQILAHWSENVLVENIRDRYAITLPILAIDNHFLTVYVESTVGDMFRVHDGGRTFSELYSRGIHLGGQRTESIRRIAERFGAQYSECVFQALCRQSDMQRTILTIAQCASITMVEILKHKPIFDKETIQSRTSRTLRKWQPDYIKDIKTNMEIRGSRYAHRVDFIANPEDQSRNSVIVKILKPTYSAEIQSRTYGFFALDIEHTYYSNWPRLAIISKVELWNESSVKLVKGFSEGTVLVETNQEECIEEQVPYEMERLCSLVA